MTTATRTLLRQALRLSPEERAELVEGLRQSLVAAPDADVDAAWAREAESRIDAFRRGEISADSTENVLARIARR